MTPPFQDGPTSASDLPRPPADVVGGEWSAWLVAAAVVAVLVLAGLGLLAYRRWSARRRRDPRAPLPGRSARDEALRELDRIRSLGWHRNGRVGDFYAASTDALRRFAEHLEPRWSTALTSRELMARMEARWGSQGTGALASTVERAEWVKFGGERPSPDDAEADWRRIREWVRRAPEAE